LNRCSPLGGGILDRKDFDRVILESVKIGNVDMLKTGQCSPFADGTDNIVKLFNGEGFIICTLNVRDLGSIQSAYTSPLNIELRYAYRSTISKSIEISKLTSIDSRGSGDEGIVKPVPIASKTGFDSEVVSSCKGVRSGCDESYECCAGLLCGDDDECKAIPIDLTSSCKGVRSGCDESYECCAGLLCGDDDECIAS